MRGDWHRYNLKRRIASLPPISPEIFNEKVLSAQATNNAAAAKASFEKACTACQKSYYSENAYQNHIGSQKHKLRVAASFKSSGDEPGSMVSSAFSLGEPVSVDPPTTEKPDLEAEAEFEKVVDQLKDASLKEEDLMPCRPSRPHHSGLERRAAHSLSPTTVPNPQPAIITKIPLSRCLFCNYDSPNSKLSADHMTRIHGLFIPEKDYLIDMDELLRYLQLKIQENFECLFCHKVKHDIEGVQTHMRDKGHCRIAFETEEEMLEVGQFYDFSSTYSENENGEDTEVDEPANRVMNGVKLATGEGRTVGEDDGWETDSSFSSVDSNDLASVPIDDRSHQYEKLALHRHHSHTDVRPHRSADGFHSHAHHYASAVYHDDYELHLPNGRIVGHRSLRKYFRQNLRNYPTAAEGIEKAQRLLEEGQALKNGDVSMEDVDESSPDQNRNQPVMRRSEAGMLGATSAQKREVRAAEKRGRRQGRREQNRYQAKLEKQNNFQRHYRVRWLAFLDRKFFTHVLVPGPHASVAHSRAHVSALRLFPCLNNHLFACPMTKMTSVPSLHPSVLERTYVGVVSLCPRHF